MAIALFMWLAVIGPANLPVIIAEPVQAGIESEVRDDHAPQSARFMVHNARAENLGRLGEAVMAFATAGLDHPTLDINETTEARLSVRSPSRSFVDFVGNGYDYVAAFERCADCTGKFDSRRAPATS